MTSRFALRNISFTWKLAAVPVLAAIVLTGLGVLMQGHSRGQVSRLDRVVSKELSAIVGMSSAALNLRSANAALYYMLTGSAADSDSTSNIEAQTAAILVDVDSAAAKVARYLGTLTEEGERARLENAAQQLAKYREAVEFVGSMLAIDFASTVTFVEPFQENYRALNSTLEEIVASHLAASDQAALQARTESRSAIRNMLIAVLVSVIAVVSLAWLLSKATVDSITDIAGSTLRLAQGDMSEDLSRLARNDELGAISRSLVTFRENALEARRLEAAQREAENNRREAERAAEEERRSAAATRDAADRERRRREMLALAEEFERSVLQIADAVLSASREMEEMARIMSREAEGAMAKSTVATDAATEAMSHTQTVAGAAQQLYASLRATTEQVTSSTELARNAVGEATAVNDRVRALSDAAEKVSGVVNVINTIASQTRLLALNATIEAGIAGEAGKGFAVVAGEVKALANQTAQATEEIGNQIVAMQGVTRSAEAAIREILQVMTTIEQHVSSISLAVREQDSATEEIARTVESLSTQAREVTTTITGMKESTETTQSAAQRVLESALHLSRQSGSLKSEVNRLVSDLRAA